MTGHEMKLPSTVLALAKIFIPMATRSPEYWLTSKHATFDQSIQLQQQQQRNITLPGLNQGAGVATGTGTTASPAP